jgi:2-phospho-L-lactate/phosphoenolpyruvate guanylyltransferase
MPLDDRPPAWGLVVPVKRLDLAKTRLFPYGDEMRRALALAFAQDVVAAALACPMVARVLVVTDDPVACAVLSGLGARVTGDEPGAGLNPALAHGAGLLRAADPRAGVAMLSADLPALRVGDLTAVLGLVPAAGRGFVADLQGEGTTLLAAGPGVALSPSYGTGSRARHAASGAVELPAGDGLRLDVDTPDDLAAALSLGVGDVTAARLGVPAWTPAGLGSP